MIRDAASVILLRGKRDGFEVFLLRRRKGASFMASAFVFPGGGAEPGEDPRTTAARELFEEAGILLAHDIAPEGETLEVSTMAAMRRRILAGENATANLAASGLAWSLDVMVPWSHWITPSIEPKRFSARFFVAELPPGQEPQFDDIETVDQAWVKPAEALARAAELALPPPQVRTFLELSKCGSIDHVLAVAKERGEEPHPILPRMAPNPAGGFALLLPWDPEYGTAGTGDAEPFSTLASPPRWATGPSRFVLEDREWKHLHAPASTPAG